MNFISSASSFEGIIEQGNKKNKITIILREIKFAETIQQSNSVALYFL